MIYIYIYMIYIYMIYIWYIYIWYIYMIYIYDIYIYYKYVLGPAQSLVHSGKQKSSLFCKKAHLYWPLWSTITVGNGQDAIYIYISNLCSAKIAGWNIRIPICNMQKMHLQKGPFSRQLCQFTECTGVYIHHWKLDIGKSPFPMGNIHLHSWWGFPLTC